jgi:predicted lipoprotein with Yx(FWY)xxD motif
MRRSIARFLALTLLALFFAIAAWSQSGDTILAGTGANGAGILTDAKGMTLYIFTKDPNGKSVCNGGCAKAWPPFYVSTISVSPPLSAADFGSITRDDGTPQTTFRGWPLYYWFRDKQPGDMTGQGVGKVWYAVDPAKLAAKAVAPAKSGAW